MFLYTVILIAIYDKTFQCNIPRIRTGLEFMSFMLLATCFVNLGHMFLDYLQVGSEILSAGNTSNYQILGSEET